MAGLTGRRSSTTRGFHKAGKGFGFNPDKHPRAHNGQFTAKGGNSQNVANKASGEANAPGKHNPNNVGRSEARAVGRQTSKLVKDIRDSADINRAKVELLKELSHKQRQKLASLVLTNSKKTPDVTGKLSKVPLARPVANRDSVTFTGHKLEIWQGKPEAKYQGDFKVKTLRNFSYSVKHNGTDLVLNRNGNKVSFQGEEVFGVPSLHPKLREMKHESLFRDLAVQMGYVEHAASVAPPAPDWKPSLHGSVDKSLVRSAKGAGNYGGMQIHHIDQWAKKNFDEITGKVDRGEMTLDEAKAEMRTLLKPRSTVTNKAGVTTTKYEIDIRDKGHRQLIVLAAGVHDLNSPLYAANHPMGYHPDTGVLEKFGIPRTGLGGRVEFDKFRAGFWTEMYRRESFILAGEVNRRISKGDITLEQAKQLWSDAHDKAHKDYRNVLSLKNK